MIARVKELDGLSGIAALAVVASHYTGTVQRPWCILGRASQSTELGTAVSLL